MWKQAYADAANGFADAASIARTDCWLNGQKASDQTAVTETDDAKQIFYHANGKARAVNLADGYAMTLPTADFTPDYRLSAQRSRYRSDRFLLTVSRENKSTYGNTPKGWNIYLTEWLNRYIADDGFLSYNDISRTRPVRESTELLPGYTVLQYDMVINHADEIRYPYYHIAVIRKNEEYVNFYLLVMKAAAESAAELDAIVRSFAEIEAVGVAKNDQTPIACVTPDYWNDATKRYYEKLRTQTTVDWGIFSASMPDHRDPQEFDRQTVRIEEAYAYLTDKLDYQYALMPTYTHISWDDRTHEFPTEMAEKYAGGDGFNGKPVLHFTYQFTTHNNTDLNRYTPMFDILRGKYDEQFRRLARDVKAYAKPTLFRLNNEMNTDWTSYCGLVNLLDPDIYIETWRRMYDIFAEEGVDNCMWIFNPMDRTTPFCNWGEDICFMPGEGYMQIMGLTGYEMGNGETLRSFREIYTKLYEKNMPYFREFPGVISEFGAGAGGEKAFNYEERRFVDTKLARNAGLQEQWVREMFECLAQSGKPGYEFCTCIKAAVWFACNDYAHIDGKNYITNYFRLNDGVQNTLAAFREGLKKTQ